MGEGVEEIKRKLIDLFPGLSQDEHFCVTSKDTPNYNCIAWACLYDDRWIEPTYPGNPNLDCVFWWPPGVEKGMEPDILIKVFEHHGYELCDTGEREQGYRKVALYYKRDENLWTHAARELSNGYWTSKLGKYVDIQHGTPEAIESELYGEVYYFMRKKIE